MSKFSLSGKGTLLKIFFFIACLPFGLAQAVNLSEEPIQPIVAPKNLNIEKVVLGQALFHDVTLSKDNSTSCASCHDLKKGGVDNLPLCKTAENGICERNSPTVFNSVFNFRQFWDGRSTDLKDQIHDVVNRGADMHLEWPQVLERVSAKGDYVKSFDKIYGGLNKDAVADAIAEFEKSLVTVDAPFDLFLKGDKKAISDRQKRGYELFKSYGCVSCHQGRNVGGNLFQKFGILKDINLRSGRNDDLGRYQVTGNAWDKHVFKVPSLRLAVLTAPYFHDGSVATIEEAVDIMIEFQLDRPVPEQDRDDIIAFLSSLVGEYKEMTP